MTLTIRAEEPGDAAAVQEIIRSAFGATDGVVIEERLNDELRRDPALVRNLTLVAERDGRIVGQVTSSYGMLDVPGGRAPGRPLVGVGPVAVRPADQGKGVGRALLTELIGRARQAGEPALVLLGDPAFYGRFGFRPATEAGIEAPDPAWGGHFQALPLQADEPPPSGRFTYSAPFGRL